MSHEITNRDGLVLTGQPAWHGLGVVVKDAPSPKEAIRLAGLGWQVESAPLTMTRKGLTLGDDNLPRETVTTAPVPGYVANVRGDTGEVLGVVGEDFHVVQNHELAGLIYDAARSERVTVETAGSLRAGREVFFLAHLGTFAIGERDRNHSYALFVNGHDGGRALTVLPTSVRVVCANTLRAALTGGESRRLTIALRHTSGLADRLDDVRATLRGARGIAEREADKARALAAKRMTPAEVSAFFAEVYARLYGAVPPANAPARGDKAKRTRALDMAAAWQRNLLREADALATAPSAWLAYNAVSGWVDHERPGRGGDRVHSNLLGSGAEVKDTALSVALAAL